MPHLSQTQKIGSLLENEVCMPFDLDNRGQFDQLGAQDFNTAVQNLTKLDIVGGFYTLSNEFGA